MSELKEKHAIIDELMSALPDSSDPAYQAWTKEKIEKSLAEAKAHPEQRIPQRRIWEKFGLEY